MTCNSINECEIYVLRIPDQTKLFHCNFCSLDILFMSLQRHQCPFWTNLMICKKFEELVTTFDMKLNRNIVKYMFLKSCTFDMKLNRNIVKYMFLKSYHTKTFHCGFYTFDTLFMYRKASVPFMDQFWGYVKKSKNYSSSLLQFV